VVAEFFRTRHIKFLNRLLRPLVWASQ
jgi:hypothetical protein